MTVFARVNAQKAITRMYSEIVPLASDQVQGCCSGSSVISLPPIARSQGPLANREGFVRTLIANEGKTDSLLV